MELTRISEYLKKQELDLRVRGTQPFSRFMDQKVTPDVLWVIAETINELTSAVNDTEFSSSSIWTHERLEERVTRYFQKPSVHDANVRNEIDKFIGQCLNTLNYSGIIEISDLRRGSGGTKFRVKNKEILEFIASSTHNALFFLQVYIEAVLKQSGFWHYIEDFITYNNRESYYSLKDAFDSFLKTNTNISPDNMYESGRIFAKVINPIAYRYHVFGSAKGHLAKEQSSFTDLIYNEKNWRDLDKKKNISRAGYREQLEHDKIVKNQLPYLVNQAMESVRALHRPKSEVLDDAAAGNANYVHHIFPRNEFEEISYYKENLILLTPEQHMNRAHPNGNTREIHKGYQAICLLSKLKSIKQYEQLGFYSRYNFIEVLNTGLDLDLKQDATYNEIENAIKRKYGGM